MGREIRMVPANWEHPTVDAFRFTPGEGYGNKTELQPMYDDTFENAAAEWKREFAEWESGKRPDYCDDESSKLEFWEWHGTHPDRKYYRPWKNEEATWFQLWETVSEGTPVSPAFEERQELADYLAVNGDYWDQKRGLGGWGQKSADAFVWVGWAPSMIVSNGKVIDAKDCALYEKENQ